MGRRGLPRRLVVGLDPGGAGWGAQRSPIRRPMRAALLGRASGRPRASKRPQQRLPCHTECSPCKSRRTVTRRRHSSAARAAWAPAAGRRRDHDIVAPDGPLLQVTEDRVEVDVVQGHEGRRGIGRRVGELRVVVGRKRR